VSDRHGRRKGPFGGIQRSTLGRLIIGPEHLVLHGPGVLRSALEVFRAAKLHQFLMLQAAKQVYTAEGSLDQLGKFGVNPPP